MQPANGCLRFRSALRNSAISFVAVLLGTVSIWAHPEKGSPAPPLIFTQLLQAPLGARTDWPSLKGKVVVLDFWATWCSPCVASIPHLDDLVSSLDPAKFQFISIDDEDPKAIQTFLAAKKMAGWVGIDTSGGVLAWYGIKSWPTTIIVDGNGKIVAVTDIDSVTAADLQAVAEGKTVSFKPTTEIVTSSGASAADSATRSLFALSLSKAAPDAKYTRVNHPPTGTDLLGEDADGLVTEAKTVTKPAYILRAIDASKKLLSPSASTRKVKRGYWHGTFILMNGTMDDLSYVLATGLENPVINGTGINGNFDARFKVAAGNVDSLNAVLKENLGLELVPGNQEKSIAVFELSKQESSKP